MKKLIMPVFIFFCVSFLYAQRGSTEFIDSPSWLLAGDVPPEEQSQAEQQPRVSTTPVANEPERREGAQEKPSEKTKKNKNSRRTPEEEGRWHPGIYVTPVLNWTGSIKGAYKQGGVSVSATPALILDVRVFRRFYVGTGLAFNTMGGKIDFPDRVEISNLGPDPDAKRTVKHTRSYYFSYMELPVRLKLKTPDYIGGKGSLYGVAAMHIGFGTLYTYYDKFTNVEYLNQEDKKWVSGTLSSQGDLSAESKLTNISVVGQFGYQHTFSKHFALTAGVEYHFGCLKPMDGKLEFNPNYNNHQLGIVLGVIF